MTKDQFDRQQWRKGMKIKNTVTGAVFEVGGVDFGGRICLLIHGTPCWLPYADYKVMEEGR